MTTEKNEQLAYILGNVAVGIAILDATNLHICYVNSYLQALLEERWWKQDLRGMPVDEVIPTKLRAFILPILQSMAISRQHLHFIEVPFEGFLETRGRTYWKITLEYRATTTLQREEREAPKDDNRIIITIEDVTETVRSRLHLNAIHSISAVIAEPASLHLVLDRILQVLQEMFGSKRCAIFLLDHPNTHMEARIRSYEEMASTTDEQKLQMARIAAQKGLHFSSYSWHPQVNEQILLHRIMNEHHTVIIPDTKIIPEIILPYIEHKGEARRPGSVLSVPIFEPRTTRKVVPDLAATSLRQDHSDAVLGCIEVYHRRTRGFPAEEVERLEQFAQQAGLAIQNARLFHSIDRWARAASRLARQKENVMQAIPDGVVICDPRWRVADINQAARQLIGWTNRIIGLPLPQALAQSQATFLPEEQHQPTDVREIEQWALAGKVNVIKLRGTNGKEYSIHCTYNPIKDDLGDIFAFIIVYHDVTDQVAARERIEAEVITRTAELKQRNEALQQIQEEQAISNARLALLLKSLPTGVILVSAEDTTITVINQQAVQILQSVGIPLQPDSDPEEACHLAVGRNCEQLLRSITWYNTKNNSIPYEENPLYKALILGQSSEAELHTRKIAGQTIHLLVNAAPLRTPDGTIASAVLVYQEITKIKTLEHAREDFFTTMAHELKTPLANIRAHLSALLARDLQWSNEEQYDFLQTADEQVDRLVGMINQFLDASRVEAGALHLGIEPILLPELFEDLQDRLEALITTSNRWLDIHLPDQLPAVRGDYELLISVLTNLLSNAFRYAPEGDAVQLKATLVFAEQNIQPTGVQLSVTDRGPGISLEQQAILFTRFSTFAAMNRPLMDSPGQPEIAQHRHSSRWSPATGLGLYISRGIIEAHGSQLTLNSSPGQGATFAFILPIFQKNTQPIANGQPGKPIQDKDSVE